MRQLSILILSSILLIASSSSIIAKEEKKGYDYLGNAQKNYNRSADNYLKNPTPTNNSFMKQYEQILKQREKEFKK